MDQSNLKNNTNEISIDKNDLFEIATEDRLYKGLTKGKQLLFKIIYFFANLYY